MKNFFAEFKKFITRGNVIDMAVGVIVGSSFTAIVNGLSNFVLKPIINWILALIFGANSLDEVYTFLTKKTLEDGSIDLANSIYIDWGSFINAIINFFLIALVLFSIVKLINKFRGEFTENIKGKFSKEDKAELKKRGIKKSDKEAVAAYFAEKAAKAAQAKAEEEAAAAEAARIAKENSTEELLKKILIELKNK